MKYIYNNPKNQQYRKKFRNNFTFCEIILWENIKNKKLGYKFRRQFGIGYYIVGFCCPELRLVIEVDGYSHDNEKQYNYDVRRQKYLEGLNYSALRISDRDIVSDEDQVCGLISNYIEQLIEGTTSVPLEPLLLP